MSCWGFNIEQARFMEWVNNHLLLPLGAFAPRAASRVKFAAFDACRSWTAAWACCADLAVGDCGGENAPRSRRSVAEPLDTATAGLVAVWRDGDCAVLTSDTVGGTGSTRASPGCMMRLGWSGRRQTG